MFVVQQIPDSNLVLVVTQADCDCSRQYGAILLEPKEIKYILHWLKNKTAPCWAQTVTAGRTQLCADTAGNPILSRDQSAFKIPPLQPRVLMLVDILLEEQPNEKVM